MAYVTIEEFTLRGLSDVVLCKLTEPQLQDFLDNAASTMDDYLAARYDLPFAAPYAGTLQRCNINIAAYDILVFFGYRPTGPDTVFKERHDACMMRLKAICNGECGLAVPTTENGERAPSVSTGSPSTSTVDGGGSCGTVSGDLYPTRGW